jgi:predicted branched-subunit amino acid permease
LLRRPPPPEASPFAWYVQGLKEGVNLPAFVLFATFVGIGSMMHDSGFSLLWAQLATILIWAGPGQIIITSAMASNETPLLIAFAVSMSSLRLLPMVTSLMPFLRAAKPGRLTLFLCAHLTAISMWTEGFRLLPNTPINRRVQLYLGLGSALLASATLATWVGYAIAGRIPIAFAAGLLFLTPCFFLLTLLVNAKRVPDYLPILAGFVILVVTTPLNTGFELAFAGVGGGTLAYFGMRWMEGKRDDVG